MLLIGQGERIVPIGSPQPRHCPGCETVADFQPRLRYRYGSFDLLFGFSYGKRYELACTRCEHGWILDTRLTERELGKVPIPFHLRFGLPAMLVLLALLGAAAYAVRHPG